MFRKNNSSVLRLFSIVLIGMMVLPEVHARRPSIEDLQKQILAIEEEVEDIGNRERSVEYQLIVESVIVDSTLTELIILGRNFNNGNNPVVTLGGTTLSLTFFSDTEIRVISEEKLENGDYLLSIETGETRQQFDSYDLTIGLPKPTAPGAFGNYLPRNVGVRYEEDTDGFIFGWAKCLSDHLTDNYYAEIYVDDQRVIRIGHHSSPSGPPYTYDSFMLPVALGQPWKASVYKCTYDSLYFLPVGQ